MKRKFFAVFVLLLAVMLVTCDLVEQPVASKADVPKFTDDGRPLVGLSINVGNVSISRALTSGPATQTAVDYYEVAFKDPNPLGNNHVYRKAFTTATIGSGKIFVPQDDYPADTDAILFAGINGSPPTLLAVGHLINTASVAYPLPTGTGTTTIDGDTTTVVFELTALTNAVSTNSASSTFKIIGPSAPTDYKTVSLASVPAIDVFENTVLYPVFDLPGPGLHTPADDFDHSSLPYAGNDIMGHYQITIPHSTGMVLQGVWGFQSAGQPYGTDDTGVTVTVTPIYPATAAGTSIDGNFYFRINVPGVSGNSGLSKIYITVPVYAINSTSTSDNKNGTTAGTWNIRGGTSNATLDNGPNSAGGAVLLGVGGHVKPTYEPDWANVGITPSFP